MDGIHVFKTCPMCSLAWNSRDEFLRDGSLELNGYQADLEELELGLFYFTHHRDGCHSTMVIETRDFLDLYTGERFNLPRTGEEDCPGYCLDIDQLDRCTAQCECAYVREIIQIIKDMQQGGDGQYRSSSA